MVGIILAVVKIPQSSANSPSAAEMPPQTTSTSSINEKSLEISELNDETIQVDDKIYSVTALAESHPGGQIFVKSFAGRDATETFLSYHRRKFPHSKMINAKVGSAPKQKNEQADDEYLELCLILDQILPRSKSFAPLSYYSKVLFLLSSSFAIEFYMHWTASYEWYTCALLGWLMALIGLNIQHDANHGAVSRAPIVNRILGCSQNWIGGSAIRWIHQHVVQHHVCTNDVHDDPDISGNPLLRLNPLKPLMSYQCVQHIYMFLLIAIFGYVVTLSSLVDVVKGVMYTPMSKYLRPNRVFETFTSSFFIARWFLLPLYQKPSFNTFLNIAPMFSVAGFYLAFFFIISHNFVGVQMFDKSNAKTSQSFLRRQVASSSNVGGRFLCFLNGGLNYQIEHHLFPRIHHSHYPTIAPVVREFCLKKNIPYVHFGSLGENMASCLEHLRALGTEKDAVVVTLQE